MLRYAFIPAATLVFTVSAGAQVIVPVPQPVTESEIRDDSIKMRSVELERVKRGLSAEGPRTEAITVPFRQIKKDFEGIQQNQDAIIEEYTTARRIDYRKIGRLAKRLNRKALRLEKSLFGGPVEDKGEGSDKPDRDTVRELIIDLDKSIGQFVSSPIFNSSKVVDPDESAAAKTELERIITISLRLSQSAQKRVD